MMALPTDIPFVGGGLTVWEGPHNDEKKYVYDLAAGDICFLDNFIFHQGLAETLGTVHLQKHLLTHLSTSPPAGNPITSGERWALVIFYSVKVFSPSCHIVKIPYNAADQKLLIIFHVP